MEVVTHTILTSESPSTEIIGLKLGELLQGGECIELLSDIGGGKTTFVRGLARGIGSIDAVSSPTFTVAKQYAGQHLTIYHYDFYRLEEPGVVQEELREGLEDSAGITVIEWGESVKSVLPENRITVQIERMSDESEGRMLKISIPKQMNHLMGIDL